MIKYLLSKDADVNYKLKPRTEENDDARESMTPLILNAYAGFDKLVTEGRIAYPKYSKNRNKSSTFAQLSLF